MKIAAIGRGEVGKTSFLGNLRFSDELLVSIRREPEFKYIGKLEYDQGVEQFNLQGQSLLSLPEDSPAFISLKKIAAAAGY